MRVGDRQGARSIGRRQVLLGLTTLAALGGLTACGGESATVIEMKPDLTFAPAAVTVKPGTTITFRNPGDGGMAHTATGDPNKSSLADSVVLPAGASPWDSGVVAPGSEWTLTLTVPGTYQYTCLIHESDGMIGTITVAE